MKKIIIASILCMIFSATQSTVFAAAPVITLKNMMPDTGSIPVKVSSATPVLFETIEEINTERIQVSNIIRLKVRRNVVVKGKVVISANAMAEGHVTRVWRATANSSGGAEIEVRDVQATDDTMINLSGTFQLSGLCEAGQPCVIPPRFPINAHVASNSIVIIEE